MIKIVNMTKDHIDKVVSLEEELLLETIGHEMLQAELHNKYAIFYCALDGDEVVGYIGAWVIPNICEILNFVVDKAYQHQGIGRMLFNKITNYAIENECDSIILDVRQSNYQAIKFYTLQGFKKISIRPKYYKNLEDALVMRKDLYENLSN